MQNESFVVKEREAEDRDKNKKPPKDRVIP